MGNKADFEDFCNYIAEHIKEYLPDQCRDMDVRLVDGEDLGSSDDRKGIILFGDAEHYEDHSDYLKSWIGVLRDDYNELFRAARDAEAIADRLVSNYTKKYRIEHRIDNTEESCSNGIFENTDNKYKKKGRN